MDKKATKGLSMVALLVAILATSTAVQAAHVVGLSNVSTGDGNEANFGTALVQSGLLGETITLDLNSFLADSSPDPVAINDSIDMRITAPNGYKITSISYLEEGFATTTQGVAFASGSLTTTSAVTPQTTSNFANVIIGQNSNSAPWQIGTGNLLLPELDWVDVSVTNFIAAVAFGPGNAASIEKTSAILSVGLTAIPIPPAIWMMGAAITALVTVGRRNAA